MVSNGTLMEMLTQKETLAWYNVNIPQCLGGPILNAYLEVGVVVIRVLGLPHLHRHTGFLHKLAGRQ